jgi:hypothetical protein
MIDINKKYRTRCGREVRIYATDGSGEWTVHGAIQGKNGQWYPHIWLSNGAHLSYCDHDNDLIEVLRLKRTLWVNVYGRPDDVTAYNYKWKADQSVSPRIACIKVELDFEEGEGL